MAAFGDAAGLKRVLKSFPLLSTREQAAAELGMGTYSDAMAGREDEIDPHDLAGSEAAADIRLVRNASWDPVSGEIDRRPLG
jgi:hypothetical protein